MIGIIVPCHRYVLVLCTKCQQNMRLPKIANELTRFMQMVKSLPTLVGNN